MIEPRLRDFASSYRTTFLYRYFAIGILLALSLLFEDAFQAAAQRGRWLGSQGLIQNKTGFGINAAAFSPDGKLAAISQRSILTTYEVSGNKILWSRRVEQGEITALVFSRDGRALVSFTSVFTKVSPLGKPLLRSVSVMTWDALTGGIENETAEERIDSIEHAAFSSEGTLFGVATRGGHEIFLWNISAGKLLPIPCQGGFSEVSAAFSPSADTVAISISTFGASFGAPNSVDIKTYDTGTGLLLIKAATGWSTMSFHALAFSPDGSTLAFSADDWAASNRGEIRFLGLETKKIVRTISKLDIAVDALAFSADGKSLVAAGLDYISNRSRFVDDAFPLDRKSKVCVWDMDTGKLRTAVQTTTRANQGIRSRILKSVVVPEHELLAVIGNGALCFYEMKTALLRGVIRAPNPKTGTLVFGKDITAEGTEIPRMLKARGVSADRIIAVSVSQHGQLNAASDDGMIYLWDAATGRGINRIRVGAPTRIMAWSADAKLLAVGEPREGEITIVNASTGAVVRKLSSASEQLTVLAFSPDGGWSAGGGARGAITLWRTGKWQALPPIAGHSGAVTAIGFSGASALLASAAGDRVVRVWNLASQELMQTLQGHKKPIYSVAFSPDGAMLASGAADSEIILWDVRGRIPVRNLKGHVGPVRSVCFSPDGSLLATAGDTSLMIWNPKTGKRIDVLTERGTAGTVSTSRGNLNVLNLRTNPLLRYPESILTTAFSADGRLLACGGGNNSLLVWDTSTWEYRILRSSDTIW